MRKTAIRFLVLTFLLVGGGFVGVDRAAASVSSSTRDVLEFDQRVAAQRAIEEVYWRHRLWPEANPGPKPALSEIFPDDALRAKVEDYLKKSNALEARWQRPVTTEQLQAELRRMSRQTRDPALLRNPGRQDRDPGSRGAAPAGRLRAGTARARRVERLGRMIVVFTGPTLSAAEARGALHADYRPPAAQGDVYRAAVERPWAIGIIDGYFEHVPAVWHKEILWAMSRGVHVLGASSMGALRAAELEAFGMVGVGGIFEDYRDGRLEDDDEVAVAHAGAGDGFRAGSEAMVNIRATLGRALADGVLDRGGYGTLERIGKSLHYAERGYPAIMRRAADAGIPVARLERFREWLAKSRVDRKRDDALLLLRVLGERFAERPEPKQVGYTFQRTEIWEHALRQPGRRGSGSDGATDESELLLDELRLLGRSAYRDRRDVALMRTLAEEEAERHGVDVSETTLRRVTEAFRQRLGLDTAESVSAWIAEQGLDPGAFGRLMEEEARLAAIRRMYGWEARRLCATDLRLQGRYASLAARARDKDRLLRHHGLGAPALESAGIGRNDLLRWHFEGRLGGAIPDDLEGYSNDLDLAGSDVLVQMLLREYVAGRLSERSS